MKFLLIVLTIHLVVELISNWRSNDREEKLNEEEDDDMTIHPAESNVR